MATTKRQPGEVRDAIMAYLSDRPSGASIAEIIAGVEDQIGEVAPSSVRSYLQLNVGIAFDKLRPGVYRVKRRTARARKA